jgi:hypothetical protein
MNALLRRAAFGNDLKPAEQREPEQATKTPREGLLAGGPREAPPFNRDLFADANNALREAALRRL